eukprot:TRINITY_DN5501_c0_g1_i1.p1 TRINITY_DN5501_c0_g1~~TRINITY_DN5501_c0_g1_i1.p1  ORF type:complete len:207 (+),score=36.69 TRINITY_DN5501_c0_g1_i1:130-750(+)
MESAKEISELARQLQKRKQSQLAADPATGETAQEVQIHDWINDLGMSSFVSKESVGGGDYHKEMARQLLDFLQEPLKLQHGIMTLVDVYCIYNRARGTDLVSPSDLAAACQQLSKLPNSNIKTGTIGVAPKSVAIIRLDELAGHQKIESLLSSDDSFISISGLASKLKLSIHVASAILEDAEASGVICRDEQATEGVVYYKNLFSR